MACIIQMQRRAIEELRPTNGSRAVNRLLANTLKTITGIPRTQFALDQDVSLHILGVSEGYGTCAGIHGMNVMVLSTDPPARSLSDEDWRKVRSAEYSVILSSRGGGVWRVLELLEPTSINVSREPLLVTFERTGKKASYVQLV